MSSNQPEADVLRKLLKYNPDTGKLTWLPRSVETAPTAIEANRWNKIYAGRAALACDMGRGYLGGNLLGRRASAHRTCFAIFHGRWPIQDIDHIDGNRANNRIKNLREVTRLENSRNQKLHSNNSSGASGVYFCSQKQRWRVKIGVAGKRIHLGSFRRLEDAIAARMQGDRDFGFHPNHGRVG